jgi:hypothetical protein
MATVTIEYDLENPEDSSAFSRAVKATDMALALWEITKEKKIRREDIFRILDDRGIDLDKLLI